MLDITASYHCIQFQEKLMNQSWENGKKPSFGTDFGSFGLNRLQIFFVILPLPDVRQSFKLCMQFQGKLMNLTLENGKKSSFMQHFGPFDASLGRKFF